MKIRWILIVVVLLNSCAGGVQVSDTDKLYSQLNSTRQGYDSLETAIESQNAHIASLEQNLTLYQEVNQKLTEGNRALTDRLRDMQLNSLNVDTVVVNNVKEVVVSRTNTEVFLPQSTAGKIALYCPPAMYYKESSDVFGFISDLISDEMVKSKMIERIKEEGIELPDNANSNTLVKAIQFYNLIELRLEDSDNEGFTIKKIHENDKQEVKQSMEGWRWSVTPNSNEPKQELIFKAIIYKADGSVDVSFTRTYKIQVDIRPSNFIHNTKILIVNNPQWAIGSIIIPLITFFWGRYQERRKNKAKAS